MSSLPALSIAAAVVAGAQSDPLNGTPRLMKQAKVEFVDDGAAKPVGINRFIGRRPIARSATPRARRSKGAGLDRRGHEERLEGRVSTMTALA